MRAGRSSWECVVGTGRACAAVLQDRAAAATDGQPTHPLQGLRVQARGCAGRVCAGSPVRRRWSHKIRQWMYEALPPGTAVHSAWQPPATGARHTHIPNQGCGVVLRVVSAAAAAAADIAPPSHQQHKSTIPPSRCSKLCAARRPAAARERRPSSEVRMRWHQVARCGGEASRRTPGPLLCTTPLVRWSAAAAACPPTPHAPARRLARPTTYRARKMSAASPARTSKNHQPTP